MNDIINFKIKYLNKEALFTLKHHLPEKEKETYQRMKDYHQAHIEIALWMLEEAKRLEYTLV